MHSVNLLLQSRINRTARIKTVTFLSFEHVQQISLPIVESNRMKYTFLMFISAVDHISSISLSD